MSRTNELPPGWSFQGAPTRGDFGVIQHIVDEYGENFEQIGFNDETARRNAIEEAWKTYEKRRVADPLDTVDEMNKKSMTLFQLQKAVMLLSAAIREGRRHC